MAAVNKVILIGNLGKDPEMRYTPGGQAVVNFSLATSESWTDKQGAKQERTEWHRTVCFGKTAELAHQYLGKGSLVYVEGKLQTRQWDDRDGNKRYTTEIVVNNLTFLGRRGEGAGGGAGGSSRHSGMDQSEPDMGGQHRGHGGSGGHGGTHGGGGGHADGGDGYGPAPTDDDVPFHHLPRTRTMNI